MGVLDTFYILFKTNADEAADKVEDLDRATDKVDGSLRKTDLAATRLSASFLNMAKAAAAPLLALASFGTLSSIAMQRATAIRELDTFSVKLNSTISDVDAFQRSVQEMGGVGTQALDSLVKIGEKVNEAFSDKESGARKDFDAWKLSFKDVKGEALGATDAMLALAANLEKVSAAEALARIKKLGIEDAATIELLMMGRATLEDYIESQKEMGVVTEEQAEAVRDYYQEMGTAKNMLTSLGNSIVSAFLPAMTASIRAFSTAFGWLMKHRYVVEGFFIGVAAAVTYFFLPAMVAAAAAVIAATWPFLAIGAAIAAVGAAFALAYEDVRMFMAGQPSLIGELVERYEWFAQIVRGIGAVFEFLEDVATAALDGITAAVETAISWAQRYATAWMDFWGTFRPIFDSVKDYLGAVTELVSALYDRVSTDLIGGLLSLKDQASSTFGGFLDDIAPISDAVSTAASAIESGFTGAFNAVMTVWNNTIGLIAGKISAIADKIRGLAASIRGASDSAASGVPAPAANDNLEAAGRSVGQMLNSGRNALTAAGGSPMGSTTSGAIGAAGTTVTQTNSVTTGDINIQTQATDAQAIAREVKGALNSELRGTAAQFDDGVDR